MQASSPKDTYWQQFLDSLLPGQLRPATYCDTICFGGDAEASAIARLALDGIKTATGSLLWQYEYDSQPLPRPGDHNILVDAEALPVAVLQTTVISIVPFREVTADFAFACGEEDRSLDSWRRMYWTYIQSECQRIGRTATEQIPMVCERFTVAYRKPLLHQGS